MSLYYLLKKNIFKYFPVITVLVLFLVLLLTNLFFTNKVRTYNSDDTSWQTIFLSWKPLSNQIAYMGSKDNFIVNAPFLYLFNLLFGTNVSALFYESLIFVVFSFLIIVYSYVYFLKKCRISLSVYTLMPLLWLSSFGIGFSRLLLNPNWRVSEIGVSFIYYVLAVKLYYREVEFNKNWFSSFWLTLLVVVGGIFTYSDAYFLYFTLIPISIFYGVLFIKKLISKKYIYLSLFITAMSVIISQIIRSLVARIGLLTPGPLLSTPKLSTINSLKEGFIEAYKGFLYIFGASNQTSVSNVISDASIVFNGIILLVIAYLVIYNFYRVVKKGLFRHQTIDLRILITGLFGLISLMVYMAYALSDGGNTDTYRYLILLVFTIIIIFSMTLKIAKRYLMIVTVIITIAAVLNTVNLYNYTSILKTTGFVSGNNSNYNLIKDISSQGLRLGFANYWNGDINTYLSDGKINFIPVSCIKDKSVTDPLLFNEGLLTIPVSRSFYLLEPSISSPKSCSYASVIKQFGKPFNKIEQSDKTILIYNYDLITRMIK